jgi:prophage regulatory protein
MVTKNQTFPPSQSALWRRSLVCAQTGKSRSTIYRDISRGLFTSPVNIGGERVAWPGYEVEAINKARIAGATDEQIKTLVIELEAARSKIGAEV